MAYCDVSKKSKYLYRDIVTPKINYDLRISMFNKDDKPIEGRQQLICFPVIYGEATGAVVTIMDKEYCNIHFEDHMMFAANGKRISKENENSIRLELEKMPLEVDSLILAIIKKGADETSVDRDIELKIQVNGNYDNWKTVSVKTKEEKEASLIVLGRIFREGYEDWILDDRDYWANISNFYKKTIIDNSLPIFLS